ncbi:MAG: GNAT family N-acetyltransferase, partial [Eubacteriales bacterium]
HAVDPQGFLAGFLGENPIASISAVKYGAEFGFIGFYIVKPEFRGHGFGLRLWNAAMERLAGRNVGLDGVIAQQENYKKTGFSLAYRNVRYQGSGISAPPQDSPVIPLTQIAFAEVVAYDEALFFASRPHFLQQWINQPKSLALACQREGKLQGYGVMRQCGAGYKIGPLFADNETIADALFSSLASRAGGQFVFLDIPEPNALALSLVRKHSMSPVFETARMYTGQPPAMDLTKVFGVTSFELG